MPCIPVYLKIKEYKPLGRIVKIYALLPFEIG